MNSTDFFLKYNNKRLDYDGAFGAQCVDVIKAYFREVLGMKPISGNAVDYWREVAGFQRIPKTAFNAPKPGDIIVWRATASNPYGHIGICNWSRLMDFGGFEQNNPIGSPCHYTERAYKDVLGWLRPVPLQQPFEVPLTVIGANIPGLNEQVQKWSSGTIRLKITFEPWSFPYDPTIDYSRYARDRFCIISCNPGPEIYKTSMLDGLKTAYAIAGPDALACSYELSHMLTKYYNAHRGTNPSIENEDTLGGVLDEQRYRTYSVLKPYMASVILSV